MQFSHWKLSRRYMTEALRDGRCPRQIVKINEISRSKHRQILRVALPRYFCIATLIGCPNPSASAGNSTCIFSWRIIFLHTFYYYLSYMAVHAYDQLSSVLELFTFGVCICNLPDHEHFFLVRTTFFFCL